MKLRDKPSALRSCLSHFWDKTSARIVMCLKQKPKYMCDFFFLRHVHTYTHLKKRDKSDVIPSLVLLSLFRKEKKSKYSDDCDNPEGEGKV